MEPFRRDQGQEWERPLGSLLRQLTHDLGTLVRQEIELARTELGQKAALVGAAAAMLGAGALIAFAGLLYLLLAAVMALGAAFDSLPAASALIGVLVLLVGAGLMWAGRKSLEPESLKPTQTIESLRKDAELVRDAASTPGRSH
jgi:uncharacterized membrane protein YqjE